MKVSFIAAIIPVATLATGCAQAPADMLAAAEQSIHDATAAGAPFYAPEDFAKLQGMLGAAKAELVEQQSKVAFLRDYDKAEALLVSIQGESRHVSAVTEQRKDSAKVSAILALQAAQESVKKVQALLTDAPAGIDRAVLREMKTDLEGISHSLSEAQAALDSGDYAAVQARAHVIADKSLHVASELQSVSITTHPLAPAGISTRPPEPAETGSIPVERGLVPGSRRMKPAEVK